MFGLRVRAWGQRTERGQRMISTTCRNCGRSLETGVGFCPGCGTRTDVQSPNGGSAVQTDAGHAAPTQPVPIGTTQQLHTAPPSGGTNTRNIALMAGGLLMTIILAGVAALVWPSGASGEIIADAPIGPAGGTLPLQGGGEVDVPEGAVNKTERVVVRRTVVRERVVFPGGAVFQPGTLPLFIFGPDLNFNRPITIILPLSALATGARIFVLQNGQLRLVTLVPNLGGFVRIAVVGFQGGMLVVRA